MRQNHAARCPECMHVYEEEIEALGCGPLPETVDHRLVLICKRCVRVRMKGIVAILNRELAIGRNDN